MFGSYYEEEGRKAEYHKWDYITFADFRSGGVGAVLSYAWLWAMAIISILVYAADTFTAINLLAFNRWSSQFQPTIPINIAKWIFAGCIIFSWLLCGFQWFTAIRTIRKNSVAKDYLDPLAVNLQSLRVFGANGHGWSRFLVFAELTKSKKGTDYIALFTYFQFNGAIRILLAEGPRQVVNALTLFSLMFAQLDGKDAGSDIQQFWQNMETLAAEHREQAVILWSMAFTFIIWAISFICFLSACVLYVGFLWAYIPSADGTLSKYCRRKIEKRLERMVSKKVEETLKKQKEKERKEMDKIRKEEEKRNREGEKNRLKAGGKTTVTGKPTLPNLGDDDDISSTAPSLSRRTTNTTLPPYRPPTRNESQASNGTFKEPTLPTLADESPRPPPPARTFTQNSNVSQSSMASDRPLLQNAAPPPGVATRGPRRPPIQDSRRPSAASSAWSSNPVPQVPRDEWTASPESFQDTALPYPDDHQQQQQHRPPMNRNATGTSYNSFAPPGGVNDGQQPPRPDTASDFSLPPRPGTADAYNRPSTANASSDPYQRPGTADAFTGPYQRNAGANGYNASTRLGNFNAYPSQRPLPPRSMTTDPYQRHNTYQQSNGYQGQDPPDFEHRYQQSNLYNRQDNNGDQSWTSQHEAYEMQPPQRAWTTTPTRQQSQPYPMNAPNPLQRAQTFQDGTQGQMEVQSHVPQQQHAQRAEYVPPSYQPLQRSMTYAETSHASTQPSQSFPDGFEAPQLRRVETAPMSGNQPATPYDMSVIDAYTADNGNDWNQQSWRQPPRKGLPRRPGTGPNYH